jgi:hypothetical protein
VTDYQFKKLVEMILFIVQKSKDKEEAERELLKLLEQDKDN